MTRLLHPLSLSSSVRATVGLLTVVALTTIPSGDTHFISFHAIAATDPNVGTTVAHSLNASACTLQLSHATTTDQFTPWTTDGKLPHITPLFLAREERSGMRCHGCRAAVLLSEREEGEMQQRNDGRVSGAEPVGLR